ncbi:MAG: response regulator [Alphaproteobacteria bacterium]|nr:response regulator [Alphaproteobacteria bacterium]
MFKKTRLTSYQELLSTLPFAAQVRSNRNKVLAQNELGTTLFGDEENPFAFLRNTSDKDTLKKLETALWQNSALSFDLPLHKEMWHVRLSPLTKAILITAEKENIDLKREQSDKAQITLFQSIIQGLKIPLYLTDITGEIIYANTEFLTLIGHTFAEIMGQNITTFLDAPNLKFIPFVESDVSVSTPQGIYPFTVYQSQFETMGGNLFCGTLHPVIAPSLSTTTIDPPFPHVRISVESQTILQANPLFLKALQLEAAPRQLGDIFTPDSLQNLNNKLAKAKGLDNNAPTELTTPDGHAYQIYGDWATPDHAEIDLYFVDITPRKQLEGQVIQAHKMQAMGQLTGGIAHDFNNILTAVLGFTDLLLQQHPVGDPSFSDLMHIKGNIQRAAGLVGQLLTFSRKTPIKESLISVHDAFVDLTSLIQRAISPHCRLVMDHKRHLGLIKMDNNQLTQVFLNFAVNAKDAMPKGGELKISTTKEDIKKARPCGNDVIPAGPYVKITVTDTGSGIAPDVLPHIFDPFFTTKKKSNQSGTGLGLSTVYGIIHSAGGFIKVDSVPNVGTTFTVYLPRFDEKERTTTPVESEIQNVFLPTPQSPILLVDDEESIRTVATRALQLKGFEVESAANAEEALKILKTKTNFQLLITDMAMPDMDGEQLIKEAKKINPKLPCLLMSGYSESFEKHTSDKAKNFDFLAKPFTVPELLTKVKEILEKNQKV